MILKCFYLNVKPLLKLQPPLTYETIKHVLFGVKIKQRTTGSFDTLDTPAQTNSEGLSYVHKKKKNCDGF